MVILNAFVRPILLILSAPLILLTLGFFILIINALMLRFVPSIVSGFQVDSFGSAFWGAIVVSIVSWILSAFFRGSDGRVHVLTHHTQIKQVQGRVVDPRDVNRNTYCWDACRSGAVFLSVSRRGAGLKKFPFAKKKGFLKTATECLCDEFGHSFPPPDAFFF